VNWLSSPGSVQAAALAEVGWVLVIGATLIFALTMSLTALALRRRKGQFPVAWWVLGGGIGFPVSVLSALLGYSVLRTEGLERPPAGDPLVVGITGHLWWWEVRYHDASTGHWVTAANELRLPAGRAVQLGLSSADVIHSFWVPTLGGKMDLVPGRVNRLTVTPLAEGVHRGACTEYCGTQHAKMALHVVVLPAAEFDQWLAAQAQPAATAIDQQVQRGQRAFVNHGCAGCHDVRGLTEGSTLRPETALGPDLTHVGGRLHLGSGTLPMSHESLRTWIADVQSMKPGARMPSFAHLDAQTLDALAAYLAELR
jgi:cytochrome c oxidase subunit 2